MIRIVRSAPPAVLVEKATEWTEEYQRFLANDPNTPASAATRYRHPDVKEAVRADAPDKCAYCEAKVPHVSPGDIEHIVPKSKRPEFVVVWENLAYVCTECNRRKGDYYEPEAPLLDPFVDEPAEHLDFVGPLVLARPGSMTGYRTERRLDLSRAALVERKKEKLEQIRVLLNAWAITEGPDRDLLWREVEAQQRDEMEFAATVRSYVRIATGQGTEA